MIVTFPTAPSPTTTALTVGVEEVAGMLGAGQTIANWGDFVQGRGELE